MTALGQAILSRAQYWADLSCHETVTNGGNCIDDLQRAFSGGKLVREAYCAKFAYVCVSEACKALGVKNLLPKTAGALDMLNKAKNVSGLIVDRTPAPGAVFYRYSTAKGASGHIGIVKSIGSTTLNTIEGNNDDRIGEFHPPLSKITAANGYQFIHTELMGGGVNEAGFGLFGMLLLGGAVYYTIKNM